MRPDAHEETPFLPTMLRIAAPIALQELVFALLNFVDIFMIGQLGETQVAAVTLANQFFFLLAILMFGIGTGSAVFGAQFWGMRDVAGIRKVLGLTLAIALAAGAIFAFAAIAFPAAVLRLYTADPAVIALGSRYLRILGIGFLPFVIGNAYVFMLRSIGQVRMPVTVVIVSLLLKTGLAYLLIFGHAGLPSMGALGLATAILIMRFGLTGALLIGVYRSGGPVAASPRELTGFLQEAWLVRRFAVVVIPVIGSEFLWALAGSTYQAIYARVGTGAVAAVSISSTTESIAFVPFSGLAAGVATVIGNNIGARQTRRTSQDARQTLALAAGLGAVMCASLLIASRIVPDLYNVSAETKAAASAVMVVMAFTVVQRTTNLVMLAGIMRGGGDTRFAAAVDVGAAWLIGIPLATLLGLVLHLPIQYVVLAIFAEETVKCALSFSRVMSNRWVHNVVQPVA
jgi:putative MATE family efflux protein